MSKATDAVAMPGVVVAPLRAGDRNRASGVLARAFRDNPLNLAVIGAASSPARRQRCNAVTMENLLRVAQGRGLVLGMHVGERLGGVLVATPPYAWPFPPPPLGGQLRALLVQGLRVAAGWRTAFEALEARHPTEPHWYLGILGVEPALQRRGLGRAALAALQTRVDAAGLPAYLETDREENLRLYGGAGFEVTEELDVLGAHIWCLRRPARKAISPPTGLR